MSELKDASGVPVTSDSVTDQETVTTASVSDAGDTVAYSNHKRLLGEKKRVSADRDEWRDKAETLEAEKLKDAGKWRDVAEKAEARVKEVESKYAATMGGVVKGNAMAAILDEARKAGFQGSRATLEALVSDKLVDLDYDDQLRPGESAVLTAVKSVKDSEPRLFGTDAPKLADHKLNSIDGVAPAGPKNLKQAKDDELLALWAKANQ